MYPILRMQYQRRKARRQGPLKPWETHISNHMAWPKDIDIFIEMNNGYMMTLLDIGRFSLGERVGIPKILKQRKWGLAVAGTTTRFRRRIKMFDRFEMHTTLAGFDEKFMYMHQSLYRSDGDCAMSAVLRTALTSHKGIVPPSEMADAMGYSNWNPPLPDWIQNWSNLEDTRPWPPITPHENV